MEGSKYLVCGSTGEWNKDKPKCKRKLSRQFEELLCLLLLWEGSGWYTFLWRVLLFIWNTVSPNTFTTEFRKKNYSYCYGYKYCHGLSSFNCVIFPITVIGDLFYVIIFFTVPTCDPPQLPENVDFRLPHQKKTRSFKFQEKVLLKCQTGYFQNGIGLLTCKTKGKWTGSSFTCSRKLKTPPTIPESLGQIYNNSHYETQTLVCLTKARGDEKKKVGLWYNDNNDNNSGELLRVVIFVARFGRQ